MSYSISTIQPSYSRSQKFHIPLYFQDRLGYAMEDFTPCFFRQTFILLSHKHRGTVDHYISLYLPKLPHHVTMENKTS